MSNEYQNYEVVSLSAEKNQTETPLWVKFTVGPRGDVHGGYDEGK